MNAIWNEVNLNYNIGLRLSENANNGTCLTFDTGAAATILGLNVLLNENIITSDNSQAIFNMLMISNVKPKIFYSASKTKMACFPCFLKDVYLSDYKLDVFYFYLSIGNDNPNVALLGNDFINYCAFKKSIGSDIVITDFDSTGYIKNFIALAESSYIFPVNYIFEEISRIESTKDVASAFRYLISHSKDNN